MRRRSGAPVIIALAMLVMPALPVLSDGGGDYPPPASGDWVVTQDTWVQNETIWLDGNLTVKGANLTLDNVTLSGNRTKATQSITVLEGAGIRARNCLLRKGNADWLEIELYGSTDIRNCSFDRGADQLSIHLASASSVLSACDIKGLLIIADGLAPVLDGTTVRDSHQGVRLGFGARLSGLRVDHCDFGAVGTSDAVISNCTFEARYVSSMMYGLHPGDNARVSNCTFEDYYIGIACGVNMGPGVLANVSITDCVFTGCAMGVDSGLDTSLRSCAFRSSTGVGGNGCRALIENCSFSDTVKNSHLGRGISTDMSSSLVVRDCSFEGLNSSISLGWDASAVVENSSFTGDRAGSVGMNTGRLSVRDCTFTPDSYSGYNIRVGAPSYPNTTGSDIVGCSFNGVEKAIKFFAAGNATIARCGFRRPESPADANNATIIARGDVRLRDIVMSGGSGMALSVEEGPCRAMNATLAGGRVNVSNTGTLDLGWYLDTTILYPNGTPAEGARLAVSNRSGGLVAGMSAGPDGRTSRSEITEYIRTRNGTAYFTPLSLNASKDGLARNLSVNLNQNMDITLTLGDVTAPSVRFTSPANNTLLNRTSCRFSGTASDDQGVASVRLRAGAGDWVTADGTSEWNATLDLAQGDNSITAEASDDWGNTAGASLSVRVDSLPPVVEITYPAQDILVNSTSIELTGRTEPGATVMVNGEAAPFYLGQFTSTVALQEGRNTILASARDAAGNTGLASVNITRDTISPALTLTSPQDGAVAGQALLTVSGTAEPGARVAVNGAGAVRSGPFFSTDIMLAEGVNTIQVQAVDPAGNQASITVRVTLDRTAPLLVLDLANGTIVHSAALRLAGRTEPGASLSVNGAPVTVAPDGNFSLNISLRPGPNQIHIQASDPAGNGASLDRTVTYEEPAKPPGQAPPDSSKRVDPALMAGVALAAVIIVAALLVLLRRKNPPHSEGDDSESGSRPQGREP